MIAHVFRPRRRNANGTVTVQRLYRGRFRLQGDFRVTDVALNTTDRQVAERMLAEVIKDRERERAGLVAPRLERDAAQIGLSAHQAEFAADLRALGRTPKYARDVTQRVERLVSECSWKCPADITANSFVAWRARQTQSSPKTLNEYLNSACALLNWMVKQGRLAVNPLSGVMGRKLDFHALRYTFATKLAVSGVSARLTQELMRHSDPKLTANIYTDVAQLTYIACRFVRWSGR